MGGILGQEDVLETFNMAHISIGIRMGTHRGRFGLFLTCGIKVGLCNLQPKGTSRV